ncbi:ATP-dependent DNA helicase PIF1 [Venturia nashicola]|uniref:ATP-dependent DNA helicase n=1 Tax=Venturia nashicola TaxID=86259 RepID=A0A4Z1NNK6_9PEZI|nr:ATP-dependent DNA helicase PIF1 [Venturia nashicola]TLD26303.1 ATP-dependent DNA helicase PIF1 [Venturia nashicola]
MPRNFKKRSFIKRYTLSVPIPPARLGVDYGDRVVEMKTIRNPQNERSLENHGNFNSAPPFQLSTAVSQQQNTKQALKDRLAAARREVAALDARLRAQTVGQTRPTARKGPSFPAKFEPELCEEQRNLVDLILSGRNVFYTGSAGCGKSTILKTLVRELMAREKKVVICAPTGKAALEVNGCTFWTFAGWTPSRFKKSLETLKEAASDDGFVRERMNNVDTLIIDEISMMENFAFERLNEVMKTARDSHDAFGGVQLVVSGDFCQLPPVKPFKNCITCGCETTEKQKDTIYECPRHGEFLDVDKWAFKSLAWKQAQFQHVNLTTIHRQKDRTFIDILEKCRMGKQLTEKETGLLLNHETNVANAVRLFPTRREVATVNTTEFNKIPHQQYTFKCFDHFHQRENHPHLQWKHTRAADGTLAALSEHKFESEVRLKEGMLVVLQVNLSIEEGLVNGSQGVIVGWESYDAAETAEDVEEYQTQPMNPIFGDHAVLRATNIKLFMEKAPVKKWPIVKFDNGAQRTIFPDCVVNEMGDDEPYSIISRTQIPLIAGWAMTVHKSQGMTLDKVIVDLSKNFEKGQMYVALSRARTLNGLKVEGLAKWRGGGNEQVKEFLFEKFGIAKE